MKVMWDERFAVEEYVYGVDPNPQFKDFINRNAAGTILLPGEGEGRNAVYAAENGWEVSAIDQSVEGKKKAERLALCRDVSIQYDLGDIVKHPYESESFDAIALAFLHLPVHLRKEIHTHLLSLIKKGGKLFVIGFSEEQLNFESGGPKNVDMLFSNEKMLSDFSPIEVIHNNQFVQQLNEGLGHNGDASLIVFEGIKK